MGKDRLQEHYDKKYLHEASNSDIADISDIADVAFPTNRNEAVVKFLPKMFSGGDIIEIGAGSGAVAKKLLNSEMAINSYTISDMSFSRMEGLQKSLDDERLTPLRLDVEDIPEDLYGKFDAVIMIALIEHLIDPLGAMQEVRKLLKPGGIIYIDTPNIAKYTKRIKLLIGSFPSTASANEGLTTFSGEPVDLHDEGHLHYFTYRSLSLMLTERCNFTRIEKVGYPGGRTVFGTTVHGGLAWFWPEMFSELALVAYA